MIQPEVAQTVTPETAADALEKAEYRIRGGSYYRTAGRAELGPGFVCVDNLGSPLWYYEQERGEG